MSEPDGNIHIFPGATAEGAQSRSPHEIARAAKRYFLMEPLIKDLASRARMSEFAALWMLAEDEGPAADDLMRAFRSITADAEALSRFYKANGEQ